MLRIIKKRKGQNTAEYAILISLVVAGIIAMQTYAQRALQGKVQAASTVLAEQGTTATTDAENDPSLKWKLEDTHQYEPYYLKSNYQISRNSTEEQILDGGTDKAITTKEDTARRRAQGGSQVSTYDTDVLFKSGSKEAWSDPLLPSN